MRYVLITKLGRVMVFNVKACAELYQSIYGGALVDDQLYANVYAELLEVV